MSRENEEVSVFSNKMPDVKLRNSQFIFIESLYCSNFSNIVLSSVVNSLVLRDNWASRVEIFPLLDTVNEVALLIHGLHINYAESSRLYGDDIY